LGWPITKALTIPLLFTLGLLGVVGPCLTTQAQFNERLPTNCAGLAVMVKAEIDRMRRLQEHARKEEKAPPPDLLSAWQRAFGKKGEGSASLRELKKIRARADGLNAALRARGCPAVDIDHALQATSPLSRKR
jgi:hypothetical protein